MTLFNNWYWVAYLLSWATLSLGLRLKSLYTHKPFIAKVNTTKFCLLKGECASPDGMDRPGLVASSITTQRHIVSVSKGSVLVSASHDYPYQYLMDVEEEGRIEKHRIFNAKTNKLQAMSLEDAPEFDLEGEGQEEQDLWELKDEAVVNGLKCKVYRTKPFEPSLSVLTSAFLPTAWELAVDLESRPVQLKAINTASKEDDILEIVDFLSFDIVEDMPVKTAKLKMQSIYTGVNRKVRGAYGGDEYVVLDESSSEKPSVEAPPMPSSDIDSDETSIDWYRKNGKKRTLDWFAGGKDAIPYAKLDTTESAVKFFEKPKVHVSEVSSPKALFEHPKGCTHDEYSLVCLSGTAQLEDSEIKYKNFSISIRQEKLLDIALVYKERKVYRVVAQGFGCKQIYGWELRKACIDCSMCFNGTVDTVLKGAAADEEEREDTLFGEWYVKGSLLNVALAQFGASAPLTVKRLKHYFEVNGAFTQKLWLPFASAVATFHMIIHSSQQENGKDWHFHRTLSLKLKLNVILFKYDWDRAIPLQLYPSTCKLKH